VASEPPVSPEAFEEEFPRAQKLTKFAGDVDRKCIFAHRRPENVDETSSQYNRSESCTPRGRRPTRGTPVPVLSLVAAF
jgi:hypothetical protein